MELATRGHSVKERGPTFVGRASWKTGKVLRSELGFETKVSGLQFKNLKIPVFALNEQSRTIRRPVLLRDISRAYKKKKNITTSQLSENSRRNWDPG